MKVSLINHTADAETLLIFTKSTRLNMTPGLMDEIRAWPAERKLEELRYMANTIPSSWEFVDYTFLVEGVSRAYTHQQVRTRSASYAQQSMRVVDMGNFDFVYTARNLHDLDALRVINATLDTIQKAYRDLLALGQPVEDARGILPTNIATNIVCKFNLRTFSELVRARSGGRTQGEYQAVVSAMADAVLTVHPWAILFLFPQGRNHFADIEAFAEKHHGTDLKTKGELLKIVDQLRSAR